MHYLKCLRTDWDCKAETGVTLTLKYICKCEPMLWSLEVLDEQLTAVREEINIMYAPDFIIPFW